MPKKIGTRKKQKGSGIRKINQLATMKRKLVQRESNLKTLEETPLPKSFGAHMAKVRQEERNAQIKNMRNEIQNLKKQLNTLDPPKGRFVNINTIYKSPSKNIKGLPVKLYIFVNSPAIGGANPLGNSGPQYSRFDRKIMEQILDLRAEAFPEEYGIGSNGLKEKMISIFGEEVIPYVNASHLIWMQPYHCEATPDTPAERNIVYSLIVVPPVEKNARFYTTNMREPNLLSSCSIIHCKVDDIQVIELYGLATYAQYQKQGLGRDLLERTLQSLSKLATPTNTRLLANKYIWLFYDKTKEHLKNLYESVGFVPIHEHSENPIHKKLYISSEFLLENARKAKYEKFKEYIKRRNPFNIVVVEENDLPTYLAKKREEILKELNDRLVLSNKYGVRPNLLYFSTEENHSLNVKEFLKDPDYKAEIEEKYYQAWYKYMTVRTKFLVVVSEKDKQEAMKLTEEEAEETTEFIRKDQQMVLCLADWVARRIE
jgi:ribosomal protein S18 acetylase RimI-like enzyme